MKYIKTYEQISITQTDLRALLCDFLSKNIPTGINLIRHHTNEPEMNKYSTALALKSYDERKNISYRSPITALVIETSPVSDKQLRKETIKSKLKITVIPYALINLHEREFISKLTDFIEEIFKKYSYFYKRKPMFRFNRISVNDYYINTSDIDSIMNDLQYFDVWLNSNKYNL